MGLFKRFSTGMFNPRGIAKFVNENKITTIGFFLVLLLISIIPHSLNVMQMNKIGYSTQVEITRYFKTIDEIPYQIQNNQLVATQSNKDPKVYRLNSDLAVMFTTNEEINVNARMTIVFENDGVALQFYAVVDSVPIPLFKYSDYPTLSDIDFSRAKDGDQQFWDIMFDVFNQEYQKMLPIIKPGLIIGGLLSNMLTLILYSLLIAFFQRRILSVIIPFSKIWQISIYCLVPYVFTNVLAVFYGLTFLPFIGLILMITYGARMSLGLIQE